MRKLILRTLITMNIVAVCHFGLSQNLTDREHLPTIGHEMPNFKLAKVTHFSSSTATLSDFRGKWLFLDFWFTKCTVCINDLPKVNEIQTRFRDKINYVMVGANDKKYNRGIETLYEKLRTHYDLQLISAYDSVIASRWKITSMPHIFVINPQGVLKFITDGRDLSVDKVKDLIDGKDIHLYSTGLPIKRFTGEGIKPEKVVYRSVITRWDGEAQQVYQLLEEPVNLVARSQLESLNVSMIPLEWLYFYAYLGRLAPTSPDDSIYGLIYPKPIINLRDTSQFQYDYSIDVGKGTYNYGLLIPASQANTAKVMEIMQRDLRDAFGYEVHLETRSMPAWVFRANDQAKKRLKTKGTKRHLDGASPIAGFKAVNHSIHEVLSYITRFVDNQGTPYFDDTGITDNIDITVNAFMKNAQEVKKALQENGITMDKEERKFKVLVITDRHVDDHNN
ncbi:TlpA family protein disulfide reductase [Parachryseolinea silvisoli]|uniref:TlpA family protein disulfide reductase n=1 Tax=Parachryseolinea silvisoli TaxID=2873601 RepID=UPI002265F87C|nr:TlpA disulfide reductase family protein [Parachryseolinea silvisoli]MCD9015198.1 TlpA family protein disulfide reductase [Parachryseolinea silvisoli]